MNNITTIFNKTMKMSDLIDADYRLLLLLMRLDIPLGFAEKSVDTVCIQNGFDTDCFIFLANFQSNKTVRDVHEEFERLPIEPFLIYLKSSHSYFLENRLPGIRNKLKILFESKDKSQQAIVLSFYDNYVQEVREHMLYEDEVAFPYMYSLIQQKKTENYSIAVFKEKHNNIDEKVSDLKRILMKYISNAEDQKLMTSILLELYMTQEELENHTFIEDNLVIPRVEKIEAGIKG